MVIAVNPLLEEGRWFIRQARTPRLRTMLEFAEQEIIIPDGPYEGRRFRCSRQPYTRLWFEAVASDRWNRFVATGPTQSGKTLCAFVIVMLYHLFEVGETVICGLPNMDMAADKWREDLLPVIERSKYARLLPGAGAGSRGGHKLDAIRFRNGATLKFMSGGGGDKQRAGFTSRVVVITETDGMDESGGASREADKITQLEGRTRAYGKRKRVYMECTVSIEQGRTWRELQAGTDSRIALPCPHCGAYVTLERKHLIGWRDADSKIEAHAQAVFVCPACGEAWTDQQREDANAAGLLLHRGQDVDDEGLIVGDPPPTDTLGFRWSAVDNLFATAGDIGADEWRASREADEENAEKEMRQFVWVLPHQPAILELTQLDPNALVRRVERKWERGMVPDWTEYLTGAVDVHKRHIEWLIIAWKADATGQIIDYGRLEVEVDDRQIAVEKAILLTLREFRDLCVAGWVQADGGPRVPDQVWVDHGYQGPIVDFFCAESSGSGRTRFLPVVGRGIMQQWMMPYHPPRKRSNLIRLIGEGYHISARPGKVPLIEVNADHWKTWVHERLNTPENTPGALTFFQAPPRDHYVLVRQLTAERQVQVTVAGKGDVVRWERIRRNNHYLDCAYMASASGHLSGVRLLEVKRKGPMVTDWSKRPNREKLTTPDGRPYLVTERE